jgi:hypothetical protein
MNKTFFIFRHEFLLTIQRAGFIILTMTIPVLAILAIGIALLVTAPEESLQDKIVHIGYVDELGLADEVVEDEYARYIPYDSKETANHCSAIIFRPILSFRRIIFPQEPFSAIPWKRKMPLHQQWPP